MSAPDVVCLSHLPWAYALERPHQVMRRLARERHVFFVEEPVVTDGDARIVVRTPETNVHVVSLHVAAGTTASDIEIARRRSIAALAARTERPLLWVYAPSSLRAAVDLEPSLVVYDCVADQAARLGATDKERACEAELLARADLVLTAGTSLFDAKRACNVSTFPLPSSVDAEHFAAPSPLRDREATDLAPLRGPRVGFLGTLDDRVDLALVDWVAAALPHVSFELVGGPVGATSWRLPDRANVRWLGAQDYQDLPKHVASWDVAMIPFRTDAATTRSEPSGLLACLAANRPVVSTPLDEVAPYAERGLVRMADSAHFVSAITAALADARDPVAVALRRHARDVVFARSSWDNTCHAMMRLVDEAVMTREVAAERAGREGDRPWPARRRADGARIA